MRISAFVLFIIALSSFTACGWWGNDDTSPEVAVEPAAPGEGRLVQDCDFPNGGAVTWFDEEGVLHWTPDALASDGSMTIRLCDGDVARAIRVTGLWPGQAENWQEGAMVDRARRVVRIDDLFTLSADRPVPARRLEGVTLQCIPPLGSCEHNDTEGILAALAAGTSANP